MFRRNQDDTTNALDTGTVCPDCTPRVLPGWRIPEERLPQAGGPDDLTVLGIATAIRESTRDPDTGEYKTGDQLAQAQRMAFKTILIRLQDDAARVARSHDDALLSYAQEADAEAARGAAELDAIPEILNDSYDDPSGGQSSGVALIAEHARLKRLAAERTDGEHTKRPLARMWVILSAWVVALIDIALYWDFIFNLGSLESLASVLKWAAAACVAFIWTGAIHWVLADYQARERTSRDLRAAFDDHQRVEARGDSADAPPTAAQIKAADQKLRAALGFVTLLTLAHSAILAGRVAQLVRQAGRTVPEAAVFGAASGLFLCAFVVGLIMLMCRGNELGDLLEKGEEAIAEIADRHRIQIDEAKAARDRAKATLARAERAASHGHEDRLWVQGKYAEAMSWAATWMSLDDLPVTRSDIRKRAFPTQNAALLRAEAASGNLDRLSQRLQSVPDVFAAAAAASAAASAASAASPVPSTPALDRKALPMLPSPSGAPTTIISTEAPQHDREPPLPRWLPIAGAACAVVAALLMAGLTAAPADLPETVQNARPAAQPELLTLSVESGERIAT